MSKLLKKLKSWLHLDLVDEEEEKGIFIHGGSKIYRELVQEQQALIVEQSRTIVSLRYEVARLQRINAYQTELLEKEWENNGTA